MSILLKSLIASPLIKNPRYGSESLNVLKTAIRSFSVTRSNNDNTKNKNCYKLNAKCKLGTCLSKKRNKELGQLNCKQAKKGKKSKYKKPEGSAWDSPECNLLPCPDPYPKFDYLFPRKQFTSKVMQTWVSCPKRRKVKKVVCKYKTKKFPPLPKRDARGCKVKTACATAGTTELMKCQLKPDDPLCRKVTAPGCCPVRNPPSCRIGRKRAVCKKIECPWKSYSECDKPAPNPTRPTECGCIDVRPMCEIYLIAKKKGYIK